MSNTKTRRPLLFFFSFPMRSLMTGFLLQLCAVHRCSLALFNESRHLTPVQHKALVARAAVAATRLRRRRANNRAPATHLQKRRKVLGCHSFNKIFERHLDMTSYQDIRRRSSVAADRVPEKSVLAAALATASSTYAPARDHSGAPTPHQDQEKRASGHSKTHPNDKMAETMPPPPSRTASVKRHSRSQSAAAGRQVNRLSLTLPIAPPTSDPSRPTPTSTTMSSIPPTPIDSTIISPVDTDEFIIAIAAQERKVLELREELLRAEGELNQLKKKWCSMDAPNKRGEQRPVEPIHSAASTSDDETRRSGELDRKKLLLQHQHHNQHQNQDPNAPAPNRRRVMRGGHTRTLSLLSPAKMDGGFPQLHEERHHEPAKVPLERRPSQLAHHNLSKRASWQPRSQQTIPGYPQIVEDFKLGLRAFVEDIRQITVGDEPINGQQPTRSTSVEYRNNTNKESPSNQDTIKASHAPRPKVSNVFDAPNSATSTPKSMVRTKGALPEKEKAKAGKNKHFSWTPLGFDAVDDDDWSNWESPSSVKSSRWSGSTVGSGGLGDIQTLEEEGGQTSTPIKKKPAATEPPRTPKLDEILPNMVTRFTPSNIKRTATNLLDEWEKSLVDPQNQAQNKENTA